MTGCARRLALHIGMGIVAGAVGIGVLGTLEAPAAFGAGSGYTPTPPAAGGSATGLPGSVVTATTIQPSGGTGTSTIGSAGISVNVPTGAFSVPTQLVVTDAAGSSVAPSGGSTALVVFGVGFYQNGTKVTGTFPAVTVTVSSPSITAGSTVYLVVGSQLQAVAGAEVVNGSATFSITSDPTVEVATAAATTGAAAIPGATTVHTGEPFLLEGVVGALLVLGGGGLLLALLARRRRAA